VLEELIPTFLGGARENFLRDGHLMPVLFSFNEQIEVIGVPFQSIQDKDDFEQYLLDRLRTGKTKEFMFICETWIALGDQAAAYIRERGSLENCPGRTEALVAVYSSPFKEKVYKSKIIREGDSVALEEWGHCSDQRPATYESLFNQRFGALWERAKAGAN
jgi:hypothetical protein